MIEELYDKVYQKKYLLNGFRLSILESKEVLEESQIVWTKTLAPSLPSRNKFLVTAKLVSDCKLSTPVQFCLISLLSSKYFAQDCRRLLFFGKTYNYW